MRTTSPDQDTPSQDKGKQRLFPWAIGALAALAGVHVYRRFRADLRAAWGRIEAGGRVVQTAYGEIEYGEAGEGFPVLMLHGAGGGYDHSLLLGQSILTDGYRIIAPSRFGYLRSPAPEQAGPEAQAGASGQQQADASESGDSNVQDADYEVVDDDKS